MLRYLVKGLQASSHDKLLIKLGVRVSLLNASCMWTSWPTSVCHHFAKILASNQSSPVLSPTFSTTLYIRKLSFDIETWQSRVFFQPLRTRALFTWFLTSLHKMASDREEKVERKVGDPSVTIDKFCRQHVLQLLLRVPSRVCRTLVYLQWAPSDFISQGNNAPFTQC